MALQGIMLGKKENQEVLMEATHGLDPWIWTFQFGLLEAFNNLSILEVSNYFIKVLRDTLSLV